MQKAESAASKVYFKENKEKKIFFNKSDTINVLKSNILNEEKYKFQHEAFINEFFTRVEEISSVPLKNISLQDITIILRTFEALERTRHAIRRTWFAGITMTLGALGIFFYVIRVTLL